MIKSIHIMTMCWGQPFCSWFSRFALPSLMQPGNVPRLVADGWEVRHVVYTMDTDMPAIIEAGAFHGAKLRVEAFQVERAASLRKIQADLLIHAAERALKDDAIFVPASAVTIWADGSLANVVNVAHETDCAVGAIYLLADGEKWEASIAAGASMSGPFDAPDLAANCFEYLHPGSRSTLNAADSRAHLYGLGMMQLSPTLIAARIQVPSVAAIRFRQSDVALFRLEHDFRVWDGSHWVGRLIADGRYTFLASSDLAFQVNLMRAGKMNLTNNDVLAKVLGPMVDRRYAQRATIQGEAARAFLCSIRTSRAVVL